MSYMVSSDGLEFQEQVGFPYLQGLQPTLRSLVALSFYGDRVGTAVAELPPPRGDVTALSPQELPSTLSEYGIPAPRSTVAATPAAAAEAAGRIGFPVALKIVSPDISHKTDVGGVALDLDSAAKVETAAAVLTDAARRAAPAARLQGFLVQEMVRGVELLVGARADPHYGPMLVIGAGGTLVELMQDIAMRQLPIDRHDAQAMLARLKVARLLGGYRGRPACDTDALVQAICAFARFYLDHRHLVEEMEVNPLMVLEQGRGVRAVDVRTVPIRLADDPDTAASFNPR
jgi:acetate---CoA ligase (ADP-forming)